ncbi:MAG TPA: hypothetical protein VN418_08225, partial [Gammaproteobacteria bacterium]|nr:hypothetical protein [Gammaproteobacteria bacterium]
MINQYPLWKYLLVLVLVVAGALYSVPNLYGEDPALQVSPTRTTKVDNAILARVEDLL